MWHCCFPRILFFLAAQRVLCDTAVVPINWVHKRHMAKRDTFAAGHGQLIRPTVQTQRTVTVRLLVIVICGVSRETPNFAGGVIAEIFNEITLSRLRAPLA
jgi:hypothetical protein